MILDRNAAKKAIRSKVADPLGMSVVEAAYGIIHLTNMNMTYATRNITIERGHDPREFSLVCFGGGGGLFASALLRELEMTQAIIPVNPATFSAWGLLNSDFREDLTHTSVVPLANLPVSELKRQLAALESEGRERLRKNGISANTIAVERYAELRYLGQEHTVKVPIQESDLADSKLSSLHGRFHSLHEKTYAHALPELPVELVSLRLSVIGLTQKPDVRELVPTNDTPGNALKSSRKAYFAADESPVDCPVYDRERFVPGERVMGPAIVEEWTSTTLVLPGQQLEVDRYGNMILTVV